MNERLFASEQVLARLQLKLAELEQQLSPLLSQPNIWFKNSDIFLGGAFHSHSNELDDYLLELRNNIHKLSAISNQHQADYLTDKIAEQFSCFKNFLNSQDLNQKYIKQRKSKPSLQQRVKTIAESVTQNSQELYQELSKLQEYERRLLDMVNEKTQQLTVYKGPQKSEMQQHVLLTQQRLGRCRQAISGVEEKIQQLDSKRI